LSNSIWKNIKEEANSKAESNHPSNKRGRKTSWHYLGNLNSLNTYTLLERAKRQFNNILILANKQYNIHPRKFKIYYNAIFLSIIIYAVQIFAGE